MSEAVCVLNLMERNSPVPPQSERARPYHWSCPSKSKRAQTLCSGKSLSLPKVALPPDSNSLSLSARRPYGLLWLKYVLRELFSRLMARALTSSHKVTTTFHWPESEPHALEPSPVYLTLPYLVVIWGRNDALP